METLKLIGFFSCVGLGLVLGAWAAIVIVNIILTLGESVCEFLDRIVDKLKRRKYDR